MWVKISNILLYAGLLAVVSGAGWVFADIASKQKESIGFWILIIGFFVVMLSGIIASVWEAGKKSMQPDEESQLTKREE